MPASKAERIAVRQVIRAMHAVGAEAVDIYDGEETIDIHGEGERAIMAELFKCYEEHLSFALPEAPGFPGAYITILLVYGNDPDEVVCDWWPARGPLHEVLDQTIDNWIN